MSEIAAMSTRAMAKKGTYKRAGYSETGGPTMLYACSRPAGITAFMFMSS